jgi:hypothetical protein
MEPIEQQLSLLEQLLLAIEKRLEAFVEFALIDLRQIFQQTLVTADLRLNRFQLLEGGQLLVFLSLVIGHRRRTAKAG